MRLSAVIKYNISEFKNGILIYYGIIVAIFILFTVSIISIAVNDNASLSGIEISSAVFLFVYGLNSFKRNYLFLSSNGITRKAHFYGFLISASAVAAFMGAIDTICGNIVSNFFNYSTLFQLIYHNWFFNTSKPLTILTNFIWSTALYLFALIFGYFVTLLYYRMTKIIKIIVSIGVPVLLFWVLPGLDILIANGKITGWFGGLLLTLGGIRNGGNPYIAIVTLLAESFVFIILSFCLVKRVAVKE